MDAPQPNNLIYRFTRRLFSGKLRKPPSSPAIVESKARSYSGSSLSALMVGETSKNSTLPSPPFWASAIVLAVNIFSLVGIAILGPTLQPPKEPEDAVEYITAAIPFFVLQMTVEIIVIKAAGIDKASQAAAYDLADSWSSACSGFMQQLFLKVIAGPAIRGGAYVWVYNATANWFLPRPTMDTWFSCILLFVCVDFCYYWLHRSGHTWSILWLGHSVHHDNDHYNLSTALRQGMIQASLSWIFALPLAFIFPPGLFLTLSQANTLYQFWVHTCCIRRLGPLEWVLMTPSHHRVHHDRRVHKNFGGVFIIWDRIFGSFLDETAVYSQVKKFESKPQSLRKPLLYLGDIPLNADSGKEVQVRSEKCYFGQRRPMTSWAASIHQLDEPLTLLKRFKIDNSFSKNFKYFIEGPGYYTAGLSARNALPGKSSLSRFRLTSNPASKNDLSAIHVIAHTLLAWFAIILILVDNDSPQTGLARRSIVPVMNLISIGFYLDGGKVFVASEHCRCTLVFLFTLYQTMGRSSNLLSVVTLSNTTGLTLLINGLSAYLMLVAPQRFERVSTHH